MRRFLYDVFFSSHDIDELLRMPWFHRAWTFQEIVLASEAVFKDIAVGDQLVLIAGLPAPLVLRPSTQSSEDGYKVMAAAFVYEWAEGTALEVDQLEEIKLV